MDKNTRYSAINTKISSMLGKLLKEEDYKKIISLKSPSEIAVYLKNNTAYRDFFGQMDATSMHRDEIERMLKEGLINYMDKIIHYFNGEYRNFIKSFYIKYEIMDLKRVARLIQIDKSYENLESNLVFAGKYKYININRVAGSKSISELIQALNGTVYSPYLRSLIDGNVKENLYRFEMSLDKAYFSIIEKNMKHLLKEDKEVFKELMGSYMDMLNIRWIYRGKKYYSLSPEELFNYTLNTGCRFNYKKIKDFCYSKDINEFIRMVRNTPYGFIFKNSPDEDIFMERRMNRYLYFKLRGVKKRYTLNISIVLAYIELIEFEIRDIISMVENVRYGMEYEEARKYLIKAI